MYFPAGEKLRDPPSAQILFSDNFPAAFSAEDVAYVGDIVMDYMKKVGKQVQK